MRSLPNLVKQRFIVENKEHTRVINSNEKIEQLIGTSGREGFTPGLFAQQVDVISEDVQSEEELTGIEALVKDMGTSDEEGRTINVADGAASEKAMSEQLREQAEEMIQQAKLQAEEILSDARLHAENEAEAVKQQAYQQGMGQAQEELDLLKQSQQENLQLIQQQQQAEFQQQIEQMEPELVETILSVVQEVLHVEIEDYRPIIQDLVMQTVMQAENPKEITIYASEKNCVYLNEHIDRLKSVTGNNTKLEILTNHMLSEQECRMETEFGIYDCGFDVQLKNLSNRIRLLSHQKE